MTRRKLAWLINVNQGYVYNLANQMTDVRAHVGGATLASYEYDGNGRRVRITEGTTRSLQMYSQAGQLVYERRRHQVTRSRRQSITTWVAI